MDAIQDAAVRVTRRLREDADRLEADALAHGIAKEDIHHAVKFQWVPGTQRTELVAVLVDKPIELGSQQAQQQIDVIKREILATTLELLVKRK